MSKGGKPKDVFDVERIRQIIELMEQHDLREVDLQQGDEKIKLNRAASQPGYPSPYYPPMPMAPMAPMPQPAMQVPPQAAPATAAPVAAAAPAASDTAGTITIDAPMVGTFYARSKPGADAFVKVGDSVQEDTIVCIVEALKTFSEIPAECSGTIVEILVNDQDPIDYGKPLFRVKPN
ncbi:MAG: acetyl-CoA carboxylase biotin carboxyl carrier protein [Rubripirellula sp.]